MATEKEEIILEVKIDRQGAEKDLEKIEEVLLNNKTAVQDLNKAYKNGAITQKEYIQENIRLQANSKKEQEQKRTLLKTLETESNSRNAIKLRVAQLTKEYDNLNRSTKEGAKRADELEKELTQLNASITKTSKSAGLFKDQIGNYPDKFANATKGINVAGVSIGDLTEKISSFLNPATAAVAAVGLLSSAYAASAVGARDLQFAQDKLSAATGLLIDDFGRLVGGEDGGGGKGLVTRLGTGLAAAAISYISFGLLNDEIGKLEKNADRTAKALERLRDLEISLVFAAGDAKNDERRAEALRLIRDNESEFVDDRIEASNKIVDILNNSLLRTTTVLETQRKAVIKSVVDYETNRVAQLKVAQITAEIADKEEEINGKLTENTTARRELVKLQQEQLFLLEQEVREANKPNVSLDPIGEVGGDAAADPAIKASEARQKQFIAELETVEFTEKQKQEFYRQSLTEKQKLDELQVQSAHMVFNALTTLADQGSDAQRGLALLNIGVNTAEALVSGIASSQDIPYPGNLIAMATTVATILSNIAAAKQYLSFAEGGYTGPGYGSPDSSGYKPAGIVHEHEYVAPKRVVMSAAAQPHIQALESMRLRGYADGGLVTNTMTSEANQALITANAIRDIPPSELSVVEVTRVQKRIAVKERVARLKS